MKYISDINHIRFHDGQVEKLGSSLIAYVKDVFEASCNQETNAFSFPLQKSICRHCGAHPDPLNVISVNWLVFRIALSSFIFQDASYALSLLKIWLVSKNKMD